MTRAEAQKKAKLLASKAVAELGQCEAIREFRTSSEEEWAWLRADFASIAARLEAESKRVRT